MAYQYCKLSGDKNPIEVSADILKALGKRAQKL